MVRCGASHFTKRDNFAVAVIVLISCSRVTLIIFTQIFKLPVSVFQSIINCKSVIRIFRNEDHNNHILHEPNLERDQISNHNSFFSDNFLMSNREGDIYMYTQ